MAKKTVAELEAALEKARELEVTATEGLAGALETYGEAYAPFEVDEDGNVGGTPEELDVLQEAFRGLVGAIRANWKYRDLPTQTEERRLKAIAATNLSKARKAIKEGTATDEQVELVAAADAAKSAKAA